MYKTFVAALTLFWVLDIVNLPFMEMFDTTYPINGWIWFLIWVFIPSTSTIVQHRKDEGK